MDQESALTSKGQTTIPKGIRDRLAMQPGDRMTFTLMPDGTVLMRVKNKSVLGLAGILWEKGRKPEPNRPAVTPIIGLDTNVLIRFFVGEEQPQFDRARRLIRREANTGDPVLVSLLVLLECECVRRSRYGLGKAAGITDPKAKPRPRLSTAL